MINMMNLILRILTNVLELIFYHSRRFQRKSAVSSYSVEFRRLNAADQEFIFISITLSQKAYLLPFSIKKALTVRKKPPIKGLRIEAVEENERIGIRLVPDESASLKVFLSLCFHLVESLADCGTASEISRKLLV